MRAIGYARVSTDGQVTDGVSLEAQRARIWAWCEANGCTLISHHVDAGLSGGRADNRPALQAALAETCKERGVLIVYSLSRLARSTRDTILISERLAKAGADLVSLSEKLDTTSAAGKMVFRLLSVLNEFERDVIAERTACAMAHLRSQGQRISGRIPYGYDLSLDGENLVPNNEEQEGLRVMVALKRAGHGRRRIAAALSKQGIATKSGTNWSPQTVGAILKREAKMARVEVFAVA